jgi:hypothetical protein
MISSTVLSTQRWRICFILLSAPLALVSSGQNILNGDFTGSTTDWTSCNANVAGTLAFGGPLSSNKVAGVNGGLLSFITSDDNQLCQTISGFTIGSIYAFSFDATRCQILGTPGTVTSFINIDGGALDAVASRSGGWNLSNSSYNFTATQTTHALTISPGQTSGLGMVFDNLMITLVSPLPIELLYFTAAARNEVVDLAWATATETNNDQFLVERSIDGVQWATVAMADGAGQSLTELHYAVTDAAPLEDRSYYRLSQVDMDGSSTVSALATVIMTGPDANAPWPNPASELLNLSIWGHDAPEVQVYDAAGRSMDVLWWRNGHLATLRVKDLKPGLYYVRSIQNGNPRVAPFVVR